MSDSSVRPAATVEDVMAATGLTKRQVFRLVRDGSLPGKQITDTTYVWTAGDLDRIQRGDWSYTPPKKATDLVIDLNGRRAS